MVSVRTLGGWVIGVLVAAGAPVAAQTVHVVSGGGSAALQAAIDGAVDGDILLIEPGDYTSSFGVTITAKSLTLVGDGTPTPLAGLVTVEDLPANGRVVIRNLELVPDPAFNSFGAGLLVRNSLGPIWVEGCVLEGGDGFPTIFGFSSPGFPGLDVVDSDTVYVLDSVLQGGEGSDGSQPPFAAVPASDGGPGLRVDDTDVAVWDCTIDGGPGVTATPGFAPSSGGAGLFAFGISRLYLLGATTLGGDGGDGCTESQASFGACSGGDGLEIIEPTVSVIRLATAHTGGNGGAVQGGGTGDDGLAENVIAGAPVIDQSDPLRTLSMDTPLREGEVGTLTYRGEPGDLMVLFMSFGIGPYFQIIGKRGAFALAPPLLGPVVLGTVGPTGELGLPLPAPNVTPLGVDGILLTFQYFVSGGQGVVLSGPTSLVGIASGF